MFSSGIIGGYAASSALYFYKAEGGIPGIIDDKETGFLIEKHDSQTLADKLEYFIEHPQESKRMGENGYRKSNDKFTLRKFEESMVDILNDCLHSDKASNNV